MSEKPFIVHRKTGSRDSGTSQDTTTIMDFPAITESVRSFDPSPRSTTAEYGLPTSSLFQRSPIQDAITNAMLKLFSNHGLLEMNDCGEYRLRCTTCAGTVMHEVNCSLCGRIPPLHHVQCSNCVGISFSPPRCPTCAEALLNRAPSDSLGDSQVQDMQLRLQIDDSYEMQEWEEGAHLNRWLSDIDKWLEDKRCKENIPVPSSEDTESSLYSEESKSTIDVASLYSEEESEIVSDTSSSEYEESSFEEDGSGDRRLLYEFTPYENRAHGRGEEAAMSWFWLEESNGEYAPDTTNSLPNLSYTEYEFNGNQEGNQWMWVPSEPNGEYAPGTTNSLPNLTYTEDEFNWGNQEGIQWMWVPSEPNGEYAPGTTNSLPKLTYTEDESNWRNQEGIQWMWVPSEPNWEYVPCTTNNLPNLTYTEDESNWGNQEGIQWMWVPSDEPQIIAVPQLSNAGITDDQNSGISHWIGAEELPELLLFSEEPPEPDNASQRNENHPHPYRKPGFR